MQVVMAYHIWAFKSLKLEETELLLIGTRGEVWIVYLIYKVSAHWTFLHIVGLKDRES